MVTQKDRVYLSIKEAVRIVNESNGKKEMVEKINSLEKRQKAPPPPEGGISIREASRKYKVPSPTISRWVSRGYIPIMKRTKNNLYINESVLSKIVEKYKVDPGAGKSTLKNNLTCS